jgi:hypothetical protein
LDFGIVDFEVGVRIAVGVEGGFEVI